MEKVCLVQVADDC